MKIRDMLSPIGGRRPDKIAKTSERLQKIMLERNIKQADLARATGISRGAISNYVLGRYEPKSDIVQKLADALNCSDMWLWGYDVPMEKSLNTFDDIENPYELEVRDSFDTLKADDQIYVKDWINAFAKNPEKMKNSPSELQLTEGEQMLINLFRQVPEDKKQLVLQMIRAALETK